MPTVQSITLDDGHATPVSHVFAPRVASPELTTLVSPGSTGASIEDKKISLSFSPARPDRPTHRVKVSLTFPKVITDAYTNPSTLRAEGVARFNGDFIIPESMSSLDRDDFIAFISNLVNHAIVKGYVSELDPMY
jgi:hypothetical protein